MAITTEDTSFTHDILGRYVCNTFSEAKSSGTFDIIIIGGGTFRPHACQGPIRTQPTFGRRDQARQLSHPRSRRRTVHSAGACARPPEYELDSPQPVRADRNTLQDIPTAPRMLGPGNALPATRLELIISGLDKQAVFETGECHGTHRSASAAWRTASVADHCISGAGRPVTLEPRWKRHRRIQSRRHFRGRKR